MSLVMVLLKMSQTAHPGRKPLTTKIIALVVTKYNNWPHFVYLPSPGLDLINQILPPWVCTEANSNG